VLILYFFIGILATIVAAIPPGAANIAVVNTVVKHSVTKALFLIVGAGAGEVLISYLALHSSMTLTSYFQENPWVQIIVFLLFFVAGLFFLFRRKYKLYDKKLSETTIQPLRFLTGLLLAFLNPPVLIFWVLALTLIHKHVLMVSDMSPWLVLLLFFTGVFVGKVAVLFGYAKWGKHVEHGKNNTKRTIDLFLGVGLLVIGFIQSIRFFIE